MENLNKSKAQISTMFNGIAKNYDLLNRVLSGGIDIYWRKKGIDLLKDRSPKKILDVATGTGDLAIEAYHRLNPTQIIGVDISEEMLKVGQEKIKQRKLDSVIQLQLGDSEQLPFEDQTFDAVMVAYGVRNFETLPKGLSEMRRVLKAGGQCLILELTRPKIFGVKQAFDFYSDSVMPTIGKLISKSESAYSYLPKSVKTFPAGEEFLDICKSVGFAKAQAIPLSFGICTAYFLER